MLNLDRRDFLKLSALSFGGLATAVFLPGCGSPQEMGPGYVPKTYAEWQMDAMDYYTTHPEAISQFVPPAIYDGIARFGNKISNGSNDGYTRTTLGCGLVLEEVDVHDQNNKTHRAYNILTTMEALDSHYGHGIHDRNWSAYLLTPKDEDHGSNKLQVPSVVNLIDEAGVPTDLALATFIFNDSDTGANIRPAGYGIVEPWGGKITNTDVLGFADYGYNYKTGKINLSFGQFSPTGVVDRNDYRQITVSEVRNLPGGSCIAAEGSARGGPCWTQDGKVRGVISKVDESNQQLSGTRSTVQAIPDNFSLQIPDARNIMYMHLEGAGYKVYRKEI